MSDSGTNLATVCVLCSHNCGVRVDVEDGRIVAVRGDETNPITKGYVCNKAFAISHYVEHGDRVRQPLKRQPDGSFEVIDWATAISEIAARLNEIRARHTPRAIALVGVGGQGNHMDAPYALAFLHGIGSRRFFNAFAQEKTQHNLLDQWMFDASPATFLHADTEQTRFLLVLGTNPKISNRGHNATDTFKTLAEDRSRTVVVADPRETDTTRTATRHLQLQPGTDAYLLLAMAAVIVREERYERRFVDDQTVGFDRLRDELAAVDVATMAARCGLSVDAIVDTARGFAAAESASIFFDLGVEQTPFSTLVSYLIRALLVLTDNLGRPGGCMFQESFLPPMQDPDAAREPERALASGIPAIRALGNNGMFSPTLLPEEVLLDHPERIRAVIVEGANPILSYSDASRWREAREQLDLLVVIDPAMTETARLADYVLPTPVGYEKWEIAVFPRGVPEVYMQLRPPVVPPPPDALPEPEIYVRLCEAMDLYGPPPDALHGLAAEARTPMGAMAFLGTAQAHASGGQHQMLIWAYRTLGPHLPAPALTAPFFIAQLNAMFRPESVLRTLGPDWEGKPPFEIGTELFERMLAHPEGVEIARQRLETNLEDHLGFGDRKIRLAPEAMLPEIRRAISTAPTVDPSFPFVMAAGLRTRWTANTLQRDPAWRKGKGPHCALNLSPADASALGIRDGDTVRVATQRGSLVLPALVDRKLLTGHVWMPNGFGMVSADGMVQGGNQNELTDVTDRDPFTGIPHHRYVRCRIERLAG
ncbi:MAG: molybdopterin-dependent oxidoreductase [Candidatus Binatia bacterium]